MEKYLPEVQIETTYSIIGNLQNAEDIEYIERRLKELDEVNPVISKWIRSYSKNTKNKLYTAYCGLVVYELLYSQAEANYMRDRYQ